MFFWGQRKPDVTQVGHLLAIEQSGNESETFVHDVTLLPGHGFLPRLVITEDDEGRIVLVMRASDGSQVRRDLVEVKARATERRRFDHADSGESYVIQAATGNLGLFDGDGLIRTAKKIP